MAFLSGVLSNIKEHLGQHKNEIEFVIKVLNKNKHAGKKGFNDAIAQVVEGVRGYNDAVRDSNNKVSEIITTMINSVNDSFVGKVQAVLESPDAIDTDLSNAVDYLSDKVDECLRHTETVKRAMKTEKKHVRDLNTELRNKVVNAKDNVLHEAARLTVFAKNNLKEGKQPGDEKKKLDDMICLIKEKLVGVENCVNTKIRDDIQSLVNSLREKVTKISSDLNRIAGNLRQYIKDLTKWIHDAEKFINEEMQKDIEKILNKVKENDPSTNEEQIKIAVRDLWFQGDNLFALAKEAKGKVIADVKTALEAVRKMDGELKEDLWKVKKAIKDAIMSLGETLKKNVNQDLTVLKTNITAPLGEIVRSAHSFNKHFKATQTAIDLAIRQVDSDVKKLINLEQVGDIEGKRGKVSAVLLTAIGGGNAFEPLKTYLSKLHSEIMEPVKKAVEKIGEGIGRSGIDNTDLLKSEMTTARKELEALNNLVSESVPSTDLGNLNSILGVDIKKLSLQRYDTNVRSVVSKLLSKSISKTHLQSVLTYLSSIAQDVSTHSKNVVQQIMDKIKEKLQEEVKNVATEINSSVKDCKALVSGFGEIRVTKIKTDDENITGLAKLVSQFDNDINNELTKLQNDLDETVFKRADGAVENYDLQMVMSNFNSIYVDHIEHATINHNGGSNVLDDVIGQDGMTTLGADNRISQLGQKSFGKYKEQIKPDSVSMSTQNIDNLEGTLPTAIKNIRENMKAILKMIEPEKNLANDAKEINADTFKTPFDTINKRLDELCDGIRRHGQQADSNVKFLKDKFFKESKQNYRDAQDSIRKIKKDVEALLDSLLKGPIDLANKFINSVNTQCQATIQLLVTEVKQQVSEAQNTLVTRVNKNYITHVKAVVLSFVDKVKRDMEDLPQLIDRDMKQGYKGLMRAFEGKPEPPSVRQPTTLGSLKDAVKLDKSDIQKLASAFQQWYNPVTDYVKSEAIRVNDEENRNKYPTLPKSIETFAPRIAGIKDVFNALLNYIRTQLRCGRKVIEYLDELTDKLDVLKPDNFANTTSPTLDGLALGLRNFIAELGKSYSSHYDSQQIDWEKDETSKRNCAKVCLTLISTFFHELHYLFYNCSGAWKTHTVDSSGGTNDALKIYLTKQGYDIANLITRENSGGNVAAILTNAFKKHNEFQPYMDTQQNYSTYVDRVTNSKISHAVVSSLINYLSTYYNTCHLIAHSKPKSPCSIFDILVWLAGLPCSVVYYDLMHVAIYDLFVDPEKQATDGDVSATIVGYESLQAYPGDITYDNAQAAVTHITSASYDVLTEIRGFGDAYSMYAVDFCTNAMKFYYPTSAEECLEMLLDMLRRLLPSFRFLLARCSTAASHYGWEQCEYGKSVRPSIWQCKDHSKDQPRCQPTCQPNTAANCQPTSPLMSYLNDCLPGHLPHKLSFIGCKAKCSNCPKGLPGQPCLTPLGFRGFSGNTKTGKKLGEALTKFLDNSNINTLFGLMPKPPSTLPEHFQFALTLSTMLNNKESSKAAVGTAFNASTNEVSIDLYRDSSKLTSALTAAYGSNQSGHNESNHIPKSADMSSLSMNKSCMLAIEDNVHCGPYLQTLFCDSYNYIAAKHASVYLSWAVYLPWTLYSYLKSLFDSYSSISCQDWGCSRCVDGSSCRPGKHGDGYSCRCRSLVGCRGVLSTLYNYGFTFGDAKKLLSDTERRYCRNLYAQLQNVLKSQHIAKLFEECDNFIWTIREPFTYLVLALWSLSLFYLICVMVGRLDVLHIRSHLRSPSSHRITAQSLLAAAQVGRLAKISYLQP